ncbi:MAG: 2-amino-4-hydroxy-6-hydroxymethyldihydropteridine diphosphokinase [Gammaproteobacteria bacterium]|nr:2-amino-4-hydroxy-6-hydroxymethyldihydropteridine diphosphokinase [Gammaproteobacteria bacterium]
MLASSLNGVQGTDMGKAYIGIGSNIDREKNIRTAVNKLSRLGASISISPVYESPAYGFEGENFYNLVVGLDTADSPQELARKLQQVEDEQGRVRNVPRFSSRTLDLDLLLYDNMVVHNEQLDLPREDVEAYAFVLFPLADIAADAIHPEKGIKISAIKENFDTSGLDIWKVNVDMTMGADLSA